MTKWEFAAIVRSGTERINLSKQHYGDFARWLLVKPGNEPHTIMKPSKGPRVFPNHLKHPWQNPKRWESEKLSVEHRGGKLNDSSPIVLFEATDLLVLVNLAGAEGWEITGGLGLADGSSGNHESKWRIMRREL